MPKETVEKQRRKILRLEKKVEKLTNQVMLRDSYIKKLKKRISKILKLERKW